MKYLNRREIKEILLKLISGSLPPSLSGKAYAGTKVVRPVDLGEAWEMERYGSEGKGKERQRNENI